MCMLTKRTNILFDENLWKTLTAEANRRKTSVGKLVREAVTKMYVQDEELTKRKKAYEEILRIRKRVKGINYKEYINYGRRF